MTRETALALLQETAQDRRLTAHLLPAKRVGSSHYSIELVHRYRNLKIRVCSARRFQEVLRTWSVL